MTDQTESRERPDYEVAREELAALMTALGLTFAFEFVPLSKVSAERRASWSHSSHDGKPRPFLTWKAKLHKGTVPGEPTGPVIMETEYSAGSGHCPASKRGRTDTDRAHMIAWECEHGRKADGIAYEGREVRCWGSSKGALLPDPVDVFALLLSDSDVIDCATFEEWASDCGYDTDSRKAEAIYRACLEIGLKLRAALGDETLSKAREIAGRL